MAAKPSQTPEKKPHSVRGLRWAIPAENPSVRRTLINLKLAKPAVATVLAQQADSPQQAKEWLKTKSYSDFMKQDWPRLRNLKDLDAAALRLANTIASGKPIGISGDYDCDGNCSVALMVRFLMANGVMPERIHVHIPNREMEGYGVNEKAVQKMLDAQIGLLLTLDNGTSAYKPIQKAAEAGLDVIVADHHGNHAADGLPNALVINPNRHDEKGTIQGAKNLAAVSVTFLLCLRTLEILQQRGHYKTLPDPALRKPPNPQDWLGLVALATVGDVVSVGFGSPLNRTLVQEGLKVINQRRDPLIAALAETAQKPLPIGEEDIAFSLAPIINAPGRLGQSVAWTFLSGLASQDTSRQMGRRKQLLRGLAEIDLARTRLNPGRKGAFSAMPSEEGGMGAEEEDVLNKQMRRLEMLQQRHGASEQLREAQLLMLLSKECNQERKALEAELLREARAQAREQQALHPARATMLVAGEGWHPGLIGIVAGRLKEELGQPVVVGSMDSEKGEFKCSARSIASDDTSVDIGESFRQMREQGLLDKAGGHPMAAGGSFKVDDAAHIERKISALREGLEKALGRSAKTARQQTRLPIAGILDLNSWQHAYGRRSTAALDELVKDLDAGLRPYGQNNPRPIFAVPHAYVTGIHRSRDGKHLFFDVQQPGCDMTLSAVAFHAGGTPMEQALMTGRQHPIHLAGTLSSTGSDDGPARLQLRIEDACLAKSTALTRREAIPCLDGRVQAAKLSGIADMGAGPSAARSA